jgi:hypothetical protein
VKGSGTFQSPWPADLIKLAAHDVFENMSMVSAWQEISRGHVVGVLDAVRNRILAFVLSVESIEPRAGEGVAGSEPIAKEKLHMIVQTNIYGGTVGNVATGGAGNSLSLGSLVNQGDFSQLSARLSELGFDNDDLHELKTALDEDAKEAKPGIGRRVAGWIGKALGKAAEGILKVGVQEAATALPTLIAGYLGHR